jgi:Flp pilus assembly pilin Flp
VLKLFCNLISDKRGAGLVEYALIIVTVAIIVFAVLGALGGQLNSVFSNIRQKLRPTS